MPVSFYVPPSSNATRNFKLDCVDQKSCFKSFANLRRRDSKDRYTKLNVGSWTTVQSQMNVGPTFFTPLSSLATVLPEA